MPGMNKSSRTISLILASLARLETDASPTALEALGVLDEIRRLRRKWDAQVAARSPRRIGADFREMNGWLRRWTLAARRVLAAAEGAAAAAAAAEDEAGAAAAGAAAAAAADDLPRLRAAVDEVAAELER